MLQNFVIDKTIECITQSVVSQARSPLRGNFHVVCLPKVLAVVAELVA